MDEEAENLKVKEDSLWGILAKLNRGSMRVVRARSPCGTVHRDGDDTTSSIFAAWLNVVSILDDWIAPIDTLMKVNIDIDRWCLWMSFYWAQCLWFCCDSLVFLCIPNTACKINVCFINVRLFINVFPPQIMYYYLTAMVWHDQHFPWLANIGSSKTNMLLIENRATLHKLVKLIKWINKLDIILFTILYLSNTPFIVCIYMMQRRKVKTNWE